MSVPERRNDLMARIGEYGRNVWKTGNLLWMDDDDPYFQDVIKAINDFEDAVREQEARAHDIPDISD